jgi:hypothetical protein
MTDPIRILIVEDCPEDYETLALQLSKTSGDLAYEALERAETLEQAQAA